MIRPEDVDVVPPIQGHLSCEVTNVTFLGVHYEVIVDVDGFKWMIQTTDCIEVGDTIGIQLNPQDIHVMKKSAYSGMFGDYSTFSEDMEHLSDPTFQEDEPFDDRESGLEGDEEVPQDE